MKKLFFLAATACVALASCVKNEPADSVNEQQLISFASPVVGLHTKAATEIWNNFPTTVGFSVWAHYYAGGAYTNFASGQVYMNKVETTYDEDADGGICGWLPSPSYYWPKNGSLTFIAYSPSSVADYASVGASGIQFTNYVVTNTSVNQVDLLFSERAYDKTAVDDAEHGDDPTNADPTVTDDIYTGVHLSFKHALSSILFSVKLKEEYDENTVITLKSIALTNINSVGTFNQGLADTPAAATNLSADLWTSEKTPITYTVTANKPLDTTPYYTCNASDTAPTVADGERATDWILLPQEIKSDAKMVVTYTIKSKDSVALDQVVELPLATTNVAEWKWGKRYIYNIIIGLDTIYFEPYVANWTDGTAQDFTF